MVGGGRAPVAWEERQGLLSPDQDPEGGQGAGPLRV